LAQIRPGGAYVVCVTAAVSANQAGLIGSAVLRYRPMAPSDEVSLPAPAVGGVDFARVAPYRRVRSHRGQRNYCGDWWLQTLKRHVTFESWCERDHLIALDFDPEVAAVAAQPFSLSFQASDGCQREHVPDFFVRMVNGASVVVDVRPDNLIGVVDVEKFVATAQLCAQHGWTYRRVGEIPSPWIDNVRWLAGYRHERVRTTSIADAVRAITAAVSSAIPLGVLADEIGERVVVLPTIFHMLWRQELLVDLGSARLSFRTTVTLARGGL
jgi:hypothetical protein